MIVSWIGAAWAAACSAGGDNETTAQVNLVFQKADAALVRPPAFPLRVEAGRRHLIDAGGAPFMMMGDAAWSLIAQLSQADAVAYLDDRRARGFNAVLVNLLEHRFASKAPANIQGEPPFLTPADFATPNETYFAHAAFVLQQAADRGILVLLAPSYIGYINGDTGNGDGWYAEMQANGAEKLRAYGRYVATRFAELPNILWVQGGDGDPPDRSSVQAIARGVRDVAPQALQTVHCNVDTRTLDYWPDQDWITVNNVYTRHAIYDSVARERRRSGAMPVFFIEGQYENENYSDASATEALMRRQACHSLLAGAFGHVFGNNPIWHFDGPGLFPAPTDWRGQLDSPGARSMTVLRNLLARAEWSELEPDANRGFLSAGVRSGADAAVAAVSTSGAKAVVYMPSRRRISLKLSRLAGPRVQLTWHDPASGDVAPAIANPVENAGVSRLTPPEMNSSGFDDWLLLAESVT